MLRRTTFLSASLALACVLAACQSAAPTPGPTGQPGPTASAPPASSAPAPTAVQTPAGQPTGGGGGGAVLPEGAWTAGSAHLVVSGDYSGTHDIALSPLSLTAGDTTLLTYITESPPVSLTVSINADSVSVVVTTGEFTGGAGATQNSPCTSTFSRADASGVEGTVSCQGASVISVTGGTLERHANFEVSYSATR